MSFLDISYLELWWSFCSAERNHLCNFGKGYHEEQFCEIILNLDQWLKRCHFKDFISRALVTLDSLERNHLCIFGRGHYGEHSCEVILKFGPVIKEEMLFKEIV